MKKKTIDFERKKKRYKSFFGNCMPLLNKYVRIILNLYQVSVLIKMSLVNIKTE